MKYLNNYLVAQIILVTFLLMSKSAYSYVIEANTLTLKNGKKIILLGDNHSATFNVNANIQQQEKVFHELSKISESIGPENIDLVFEDMNLYDASGDLRNQFSNLITEEIKEECIFNWKSTKVTLGMVINCQGGNPIVHAFKANLPYTTWIYNIVPKLTLLNNLSVLKKINVKSIDPRNIGRLHILFSYIDQFTPEQVTHILNNINLENVSSPLSLQFFTKMKNFEDKCTEERFGNFHSSIKRVISREVKDLEVDSDRYKNRVFGDLTYNKENYNYTDKDFQMSINDYLSHENRENTSSIWMTLNDELCKGSNTFIFAKALDLEVLNEVLTSNDKTVTIVIAGQYHTSNIVKYLSEMDFIDKADQFNTQDISFDWTQVIQ